MTLDRKRGRPKENGARSRAGSVDPDQAAQRQGSVDDVAQELGLLRAWLRDRPVEVLDEPTAFLDAESAQRVRAILLERSRQRLVLVSTHDAELIQQADRVVRLKASDRERAERQHHPSGARS